MYSRPRRKDGTFAPSKIEWGKGFYVRLPQPISEAFERVAEARDVRVTELAREVLHEYIENLKRQG